MQIVKWIPMLLIVFCACIGSGYTNVVCKQRGIVCKDFGCVYDLSEICTMQSDDDQTERPSPPRPTTPSPLTSETPPSRRNSGAGRPPPRSEYRKTCRTPPQPQNGYRKLHRLQCPDRKDCDVLEGVEMRIGTHLVYSCNPGYRMEGATDVICINHEIWLNIPVCIEIRCRALITASTDADCTYEGKWTPCESPVLPRTRARVFCKNSYQYVFSILSTQRDDVRCNMDGKWEPEPIRCVPVCGVVPAKITPLVINGTSPKITEFPWHASLYYDVSENEPRKFFCGASIVQENLLITAGHCVYDDSDRKLLDAKKIYVATGNIYRDYDSRLHDQRLVKKNKVKNIYIICNYLGLEGNYLSDIAILELVEPFVLTASLLPVCIDPFSDQTILETGALGKVAGFGRTAHGETSYILQALTVPYISYSQCKSASIDADTERFITNDKFCAGYTNGSSVCDGDSGGGLVFKSNGLWYLRGIVSVSLGTIPQGGSTRCDHNLYSLYTRVFTHFGWIQEVIARIGQNQPYQSCPDNS